MPPVRASHVTVRISHHFWILMRKNPLYSYLVPTKPHHGRLGATQDQCHKTPVVILCFGLKWDTYLQIIGKTFHRITGMLLVRKNISNISSRKWFFRPMILRIRPRPRNGTPQDRTDQLHFRMINWSKSDFC